MRKKRLAKNNGFTLVELIVVVSVMVLLGVIFTQVLVETLRGQNKVRVLNQVKQNGQIVLDKLSASIRQGGEVQCVGDSLADSDTLDDTLVLFKPNGVVATSGAYTRFRLHVPTANTNGYLTEEVFDNSNINPTADIKELCSQLGNTAKEISLTDRDDLKGVSVTYEATDTPIFRQIKKDGFNDVITVAFRIFPGVKVGEAYEANVQETGMPIFTTTVQLRSSW